MAKIKLLSQLAFTRSHSLSVFPFFQFRDNGQPLFSLEKSGANSVAPVVIVREGIRGTKSAAGTKEAELGETNLQQVDFARIAAGYDTLLIEGNLLVSPRSLAPHTCANGKSPAEQSAAATFREKLNAFVTLAIDKGVYARLAEAYVLNLLNGSILFQNRIGSNIRCAISVDDVTVEVERDKHLTRGTVLAWSLDNITDKAVRAQVKKVVDIYTDALTGKRDSTRIDIRAAVRLGSGQDTYPSQEFVGEQEKGQGRVLARADRTDIEQAAFHGRKVANALRTIDSWYPNAFRPLPVEPYAPDTSTTVAYRVGANSFYSLLAELPRFIDELNEDKAISGDHLFVLAVLIRGGVFSGASKVEGDAASEE